MNLPPAPASDPATPHQVAASVLIQRPLAEVYAFYHDLTNLPQFLGDVMQVVRTGACTYRWTVIGPLGVELHWNVTVVEDTPLQTVRYRTGLGEVLYGEWAVHFSAPMPATTLVAETLHMPLEALTAELLTLMGKPPQAEVAANLQRLKEWLETGTITTLAHVVPGKFGQPPA